MNAARRAGLRAGEKLAALMARIDCRGGQTQIGKVLSACARRTCARKRVQALVFVGDAMEEQIDDYAPRAGELGLLGVRAFMFQEGHDPVAENAYREIARLIARRLQPVRQPARRISSANFCARSQLTPLAGVRRSPHSPAPLPRKRCSRN